MGTNPSFIFLPNSVIGLSSGPEAHIKSNPTCKILPRGSDLAKKILQIQLGICQGSLQGKQEFKPPKPNPTHLPNCTSSQTDNNTELRWPIFKGWYFWAHLIPLVWFVPVLQTQMLRPTLSFGPCLNVWKSTRCPASSLASERGLP